MSRPDDSVAGGVRAKLDRLDSYQQRHPALGVPIAVARKFIDDESINLAAVAEMHRLFPDLDLILIESGGDNLAATFSPELADLTIYVIDVAEGEKIPRKGGPGITRSDLLVINKIDLAPHVGADLGVMERDARRQRGARPFVFTNLRTGDGVAAIVQWLRTDLLLALPA